MKKSEPPHVGCYEDSILVLGYGNELRGDDAVGSRVAAAVAEWKLAGVQALAVHQLTPELADPISRAGAVIFVDAALSVESGETTVVLLQPSSQADLPAHTSDPRELLALAHALYGSCPSAWLIRIPAVSFALGQPPSGVAERGMAAALKKIRGLCRAGTDDTQKT